MSENRQVSRRAVLRGGLGGALGLAAGSSLLTACRSDAGASDTGTGGTAEVTFLAILPMTSLTFTPEYIATAAGFFEDEKVKVTFETTPGSAPAIQAMLAGQGFITRVGDFETMNAAIERDAPVLNVGMSQHRIPIRLVSHSRNPITKPEDFEGAKIGLPSAGGTSELTIDLVLTKAGLSKDAVTKQVVGGFSPASFNLVKAGRVDAYIVSNDIATILEMQEPDAVVFDPGDVIESGGQVYMTTEDIAEGDADVLKRYMRATEKAMQFVLDDAPDFEKTMETMGNSEFAKDLTVLESPEVVRAALPKYLDSWTVPGEDHLLETDADAWAAAYEEIVGTGLLPEGGKPDEWFTNKYVTG